MSFKNSYAAAVAAAVAAVVFSAAFQPAEAATFTWRTGATGTGNALNYTNPTNWVGGVAAFSSTASTTLQFTSNTTSGTIATVPGTNFGVNQLLIDGTTTYNQGSSLDMADGGSIVNTSSAKQTLSNVRPNGTGFTATSTSGTLAINMNYTALGRTVTLGGSGAKEILSTAGNIGASIVGNGGQVTIGTVGTFPQIYGSLTMNAGSLVLPVPATNIDDSFTAAAGVPVSIVGDGTQPGLITNGVVDFGGMALNVDLTLYEDATSGYANEEVVSTLFNSGAGWNGNLGSMASTASSGPYVGLTWLASGSNWVSSPINGNQQLEFRSADGAIYVVPEPTQMVFVAGVAAAFGAWRMRKLRRNARGSDATEC